ncbi:MAG: MaoC family dehydratase [Chloroflexi bacterium]|nr:MaoC family dehydratase [Chloroflexota bacterium]
MKYPETFPGKDLGVADFVVTDRMLKDYFEGLEVDASWFRDGSPYRRPLAPSLMAPDDELFFANGAYFKNSFGTLWMRQKWTFHQPLFPSEPYRAAAKIADIYQHRHRTIVIVEIELRTPQGALVAQGHHHQSFVLTQSTGTVRLRDPHAKEAQPRFEPPSGEHLESFSRLITLEMCGTFFHGDRNFHTDRASAERLGFQHIVVGGRMTLGMLGIVLDKHFGRSWYEGGRLEVKFTNVVVPGDRVSANAVITGQIEDGGKRRFQVTLWVEKADGTVAVVGTASVPA